MPRPFSQDVPARIPITQRGAVRWVRADGAYAVATGSTSVFAYCERAIPLGKTVTITRMDSFGMWRIV